MPKSKVDKRKLEVKNQEEKLLIGLYAILGKKLWHSKYSNERVDETAIWEQIQREFNESGEDASTLRIRIEDLKEKYILEFAKIKSEPKHTPTLWNYTLLDSFLRNHIDRIQTGTAPARKPRDDVAALIKTLNEVANRLNNSGERKEPPQHHDGTKPSTSQHDSRSIQSSTAPTTKPDVDVEAVFKFIVEQLKMNKSGEKPKTP